MADKTGIQQSGLQGTDTIDPVYSLAENVRKVAGGATTTEQRPENNKIKTEKTRIEKAAKMAKTKVTPAKKTAAVVVVSKKKENEKKGERAPTGAEAAEAESEDEFIDVDIPPGLFWKFSTIALAILVIWSYFFR